MTDLTGETRPVKAWSSSRTERQVRSGSRSAQTGLSESPREVLARIVPEDPHCVRRVAADRVRARALFLDLERVCLRAFALLAKWQVTSEQTIDAAATTSRVERAIDQLLEEEAAHLLEGSPEPRHFPRAFREFAKPLGLDPQRMRRACAGFHALEIEVRRSFFLVIVEGRSMEELPSHDHQDHTVILSQARFALAVLRRSTSPQSP